MRRAEEGMGKEEGQRTEDRGEFLRQVIPEVNGSVSFPLTGANKFFDMVE